MGARTHLPGLRSGAVTNYRRAQIAGGTFFFTVVTHERRSILVDDRARVALRRAFREVRSRRPFSVDAIVLLPDYLHTNPLKHGLVDRVRDWPWSSFHRYVRLGEYDSDWGSADAWWGDEWERTE